MIKNLYRSSCKVPTRYSCPILMKFEFCDSFSNTTHISNFIRIRPVGVELFRVNRRADGRTDRYDEANGRFSQFCEGAKKLLG